MDGNSISPANLFARIGTASAPAVIDVRTADDFARAETLIASAVHRAPEDVARWGKDLPSGKPLIVYGAHGREVGQGAAGALRAVGKDAVYLEGGIAGWIEQR